MPFWDKLRESTQTMQTQLLSKKNDLKSGAFRDASMAMCALVAAADGSVDPAERQRTASSSPPTRCSRTSRRTTCSAGSTTTCPS